MEYDPVLALTGPPTFLSTLFSRTNNFHPQAKGLFVTISNVSGEFKKSTWRLHPGKEPTCLYVGRDYIPVRMNEGLLILPGLIDIGNRPKSKELGFLDLTLFYPKLEYIDTSGETLPPFLYVFREGDVIWANDGGNQIHLLELNPDRALRVKEGPILKNPWKAKPIMLQSSDGQQMILMGFEGYVEIWREGRRIINHTLDEMVSTSGRYRFLLGSQNGFFVVGAGNIVSYSLENSRIKKMWSTRIISWVNDMSRPILLGNTFWYVTGDGIVVGLNSIDGREVTRVQSGCRPCLPNGIAAYGRLLGIGETKGSVILFDTEKEKIVGYYSVTKKSGEKGICLNSLWEVGDSFLVDWRPDRGHQNKWVISELKFCEGKYQYRQVERNIGTITEIL